MRLTLFLVLLVPAVTLMGQKDSAQVTSAEKINYHQYRTKLSVPPYGLTRVKDLIKKIKYNEESESVALDRATYDALSLREKFTYNMIHGESYSQNCDAMPPVSQEDKKIFAFIADMFDEYNWSDRQSTYFATNRDSVIALMKESITRSKRVGVNYKHAILEIDAKEMIPFLIDVYRSNTQVKDLDILSLFMQMMKNNEWEPFINTGMYRKLYSEESSYRSYLNYNKANEDLIIKRVMDFYNANRK